MSMRSSRANIVIQLVQRAFAERFSPRPVSGRADQMFMRQLSEADVGALRDASAALGYAADVLEGTVEIDLRQMGPRTLADVVAQSREGR